MATASAAVPREVELNFDDGIDVSKGFSSDIRLFTLEAIPDFSLSERTPRHALLARRRQLGQQRRKLTSDEDTKSAEDADACAAVMVARHEQAHEGSQQRPEASSLSAM
jgi:hypothetical protein